MRQTTKRPMVKLAFRRKDRCFEVFGLLVLVSHWGLVLTVFTTEMDNNGSKNDLLPLLITGTAVYLGATLLQKIPHHLNYLTDITEANAEKEYRKAANMLRILKTLVAICFLLISALITYNVHHHTSIAIIMVMLTLVSLIPMLHYALKNKD